jgi:hypothetical protein
MIDLNLNFPDWSDHPPPPRLSMEEYEAWIVGEILPALHAAGKLTDEEIHKHFARNEGTMTEPFVLHED